MAFENYNKGNVQKSDSVNTRGIQMKKKDGFEGSTLVVQYWDDKLNLILHPKLKNPSEKQVYDYERKIMVAMRVDKAQALLKAMDLIIDKAIEEEKENSVAVTLGLTDTTNMVVVSTMKKEGEMHVVLHVCRKLNPETRIPEERFSYTFIKDDEIVEGYNPLSGDMVDVKTIHSEYLMFKEALREFIRIAMQAQVHSDRYYDKYYRNSLIEKVSKIGAKVGALDSGHYSGSFSNNSNPFSNTGDMGGETTSLDDLKDIF